MVKPFLGRLDIESSEYLTAITDDPDAALANLRRQPASQRDGAALAD